MSDEQNDRFLAGIGDNWRRIGADHARMHQQLRRTRHLPRLLRLADISGTLALFGVGCWFAWEAIAGQSVFFALSALVLLAVPPALLPAALRARKDSLVWADETPEEVLRMSLARTEAALRMAVLGQWKMIVIQVFLAVLWIAETTGLMQAGEFLNLYTLISLVILAAYAPWLEWRRTALSRERDTCLKLIADFDAA